MAELTARYEQCKKQALERVFSRMNDCQREAVFHTEGPLLVLAGAGSGKTTVLVNRVANLIRFGHAYTRPSPASAATTENLAFLERYLTLAEPTPDDEAALEAVVADAPARSWNILAITFTNKAAAEMRARLSAMLGDRAAEVAASTFHSACLRMLRRDADRLGFDRNLTVYDPDDGQRVLRDCIKALNLDDKMFTPKGVLGAISRAKDKMLSPEDLEAEAAGEYRQKTIAQLYKMYQDGLRRANAVDFDDILYHAVRLLEQNPDVLDYYRRRWRYILVDEYQDTSEAQYRFVSLLAGEHHNLCVVGDDDQSIYKFRGATIENILSFEDQFPNAVVVRLEENYRSTGVILDAANHVIGHNEKRKGKTLWTSAERGEPILCSHSPDETGEATFVCETVLKNVREGAKFSDQAVLYRMNAQSANIERAFLRGGVPYRIYGGMRFYERKEIRDVLAYLAVIDNPNDAVRIRRVINEPKRGIGDTTVAHAIEIAGVVGIGLMEVLRGSENFAQLAGRAKSVLGFVTLMDELRTFANEHPLHELYPEMLSKTGYLASLRAQGFEGLTRIENVNELGSQISQYCETAEEPTLSGFLEEIALFTDLDNYDENADNVAMMTLHSAKGLEFPFVFMLGMEEGIFPSSQAIYSEGDIEEERRLAYVGITRAKRRLYMTTAGQRMLFGTTSRNRPSRFIEEVPEEDREMLDMQVTLQARPRPGFGTPTSRAETSSGGRSIHVGGSAAASQKEPAASYGVGERVSHSVFGEGMIVRAQPMGNDCLLEIAFDRVGTKKIMAAFAKIKKLEA